MGEWTDRMLAIDTHFSLNGPETLEFEGHNYYGRFVREHSEGASVEDKAAKCWASLDNEVSLWLTKPSLLNLLNRVGFATVYEVASPLVYDYWDRGSGVL